jgi:uncharacterized membrane protein
MPDDQMLDPRTAAALIKQAQDHARGELAIKQPRLYAAWGVAWLLGLGAMWLSVRGQHPYRAPASWAVAILAVLIVAAIAITMITTRQATRGIGGASARQAVIYGLCWPAGFAALFAIEGALSHARASNAVMGVIGATGPLLVTGLIYVVAAAIWLDTTMFGFGIWLLAVAAAAGWAGPVGALAVGALAGGGGFLATAAFLAWKKPG